MASVSRAKPKAIVESSQKIYAVIRKGAKLVAVLLVIVTVVTIVVSRNKSSPANAAVAAASPLTTTQKAPHYGPTHNVFVPADGDSEPVYPGGDEKVNWLGGGIIVHCVYRNPQTNQEEDTTSCAKDGILVREYAHDATGVNHTEEHNPVAYRIVLPD